jgi:uncharacterized membrane protein YebE (DUF533 family)
MNDEELKNLITTMINEAKEQGHVDEVAETIVRMIRAHESTGRYRQMEKDAENV